jgi:hypothetical protein
VGYHLAILRIAINGRFPTFPLSRFLTCSATRRQHRRSAIDISRTQVFTDRAPAELMSGHQQTLLSLIANVTDQIRICSRLFSNISPASVFHLKRREYQPPKGARIHKKLL